MSKSDSFHLVVAGMSPRLVRNLWDPIAAKVDFPITHIAHASFDRKAWIDAGTPSSIEATRFIRDDLDAPLPEPDRDLLASLEGENVPTIHNMIMSDRVVSRIPYDAALSYATLLARRLMTLLLELRPAAIIGDFDGLHASITYAAARHLGIPWFAMYYASMPTSHAALCTELTPASMTVVMDRPEAEVRAAAQELLSGFEGRQVRAAAYIPPTVLAPSFLLGRIPGQLRSLASVLARRRRRQVLRYTDYPNTYSVRAVFNEAYRLRRNSWNLRSADLLMHPPKGNYAFFGLHMQPESSIDVFAHFFSNQVRVIELMAKSLPPTHTLLVKLHKSDVPNYSRQDLQRFASFPGVRIVSPYADTFELIKGADLVFSIQGTIGLEGALLRKPVIMFGDSPMKMFPGVATFGRTVDLPRLVRDQLAVPPPPRRAILDALSRYLAAFNPASSNDWNLVPAAAEIDNYVRMFTALRQRLEAGGVRPVAALPATALQ